MKIIMKIVFTALFMLLQFPAFAATEVAVGSKNFTESYILGELLSFTLAQEGAVVEERFGLGGTGVVQESLRQGQIHVYPEYTGTLLETLIEKKMKNPGLEDIRRELAPQGLVVSDPLGFSNTYALIMRRETAEKLGVEKISDLKRVAPQLRGGFGHEFLKRKDGFYALKLFYGLKGLKGVKGLEHSLAYEALANKAIDITDAYTTDGKLEKFDFVILKDDLDFFPRYDAVWLARRDFVEKHPRLWRSLRELEGKLSEKLMIEMNGAVEDQIFTPREALAEFGIIAPPKGVSARKDLLNRLTRYGKQHLFLVFFAVGSALLIGFPLAYGATRNHALKQMVMFLTSVFQTIPSLALLCFLIPFFGVGTVPAMVALILYALLPIVVNSYTGLSLINRIYTDMAKQLGMSALQSLWYVQIPLALPSILDGIKTSAITTVGTATLAALIGAGGLGTPILSGLALNDQTTILEGAVPVCVLALLTQLLFQFLEKKLVSRGLY